MQDNQKKYFLDTNFFIEAWNKYYSPDFCSYYWDVIDNLAKKAIDILLDDYKNDKDLIEFTNLDFEDFYEAK